jgi:hypothetical protein
MDTLLERGEVENFYTTTGDRSLQRPDCGLRFPMYMYEGIVLNLFNSVKMIRQEVEWRPDVIDQEHINSTIYLNPKSNDEALHVFDELLHFLSATESLPEYVTYGKKIISRPSQKSCMSEIVKG